jgi:hypothetical protein
MASYLHRFLTSLKWPLRLFIILILFFTAICNIFFASRKLAITQAAGKYFTQKITLSQLFYLPPHFIIIRNVSFTETKGPEKEVLLEVPVILARFSLKELILNRRLTIVNMDALNPSGDSVRLSRFIIENFSQIIEFIRNLPWQDIKFSIKGAEFTLPGAPQIQSSLAAQCELQIRGESIRSKGFLRKDRGVKKRVKGEPLLYSFQGMLIGQDLVFSKIELGRENFRAQFWGGTDGKKLQLNGFAFANTFFKETYSAQRPFNMVQFIKRIQLFRRKPKKSAELLGLPKANFYLLDLDCRLQAELPAIRIERLSFSLNNIPFSLKGNIKLGPRFLLDLMVSSYFGNLKEAKKESLKKIDLKIKGAVERLVFRGEAFLNFDFLKKVEDSTPLEQLQADFKEVVLSFDKYPLLKWAFKDGNLFCGTDTHEYRVALSDFDSSVNCKGGRFKLVKFKSLFYDGLLYGQGRIDLERMFPKITATVRTRDVSANKLEGLLVHFSKVFGKLTSIMYFRNDPQLNLRGRVNVQNGYLNNFEFFKWLADFFDIPTLRKVDFHKASSRFFVNAKGAGLLGMNLESLDVNLNGSFGLGQNDLVSSKLSLTFSRALLQSSPKFTPLLRLLDKDLTSLCFDFQLSGILHKMNFYWLQSDFKKRLQQAIPSFIERRIDKNIEEAIHVISVEP